MKRPSIHLKDRINLRMQLLQGASSALGNPVDAAYFERLRRNLASYGQRDIPAQLSEDGGSGEVAAS